MFASVFFHRNKFKAETAVGRSLPGRCAGVSVMLLIVAALLGAGAARAVDYYSSASFDVSMGGYIGNGSSGNTGNSGTWSTTVAIYSEPKSPTQPSPNADLFFPTDAAVTVSVVGLPDPSEGPWVIDPVQETWLEVTAAGVNGAGEPMSFSSLTGYNEPYQQQQSASPVWGVEVRWYWNDTRIASITNWAKDGSHGKWGTYRAEVWDVKRQWYDPDAAANKAPNPVPDYSKMIRQQGWYKDERGSRLLGSVTFQVAVRGEEPLPEGTPPLILEQPDAEVFVDPAGPPVELVVRGNADKPFLYEWSLVNGSPVSRSPRLVIDPKNLSERGVSYRCVLYADPKELAPADVVPPAHGIRFYPSSVTSVASQEILVRWVRPPKLTSNATGLAEVGGALILKVNPVSDTPCSYAWSGPAFDSADAADRTSVSADGVLTVSPVHPGDGGNYQVRVTNAEATTVATLPVVTVQFPPPVVILREGAPLPVTKGTNDYVSIQWGKVRDPGSTRAPPAPDTIFRREGDTWIFKSGTPDLVGRYRCTATVGLRYSYERLGVRTRDTYSRYSSITVDISAVLPNLKAQQPEFELPAGQVGALYDFQPPLPEDQMALGTRFTASGLPRGLKIAVGTGRITGTPEASGDFKVRFIAANGKGTAAALVLPLHIEPLPEGVAGTFVVYGGPALDGSQGRGDLTVTSSGSFTFKGYGLKPSSGKVNVRQDGSVWVSYPGPGLRFEPETNRIVGQVTSTPTQGWRQTWSTAHPVTTRVGRYLFDGTTSAPPSGICYCAAGTQHGACTVSKTGQTVVVLYDAGRASAAPALTSAFLSPDGEVLMIPPKGSPQMAGVLAIDAQGQRIGGVTGAAYIVDGYSLPPQGSEIYGMSWVARAAVAFTYDGGRYTPMKAGQMLPGFDDEESNFMFEKGLVGVGGQLRVYGTLSRNDRITTPAPGDGKLVTLRLNRATGECAGTMRLRMPIRQGLALFWKERMLPFHAYLVPKAVGTGYRISGFLQTTACVGYSGYLWPVTSVPVTLSPVHPYVAVPGGGGDGGVSAPWDGYNGQPVPP